MKIIIRTKRIFSTYITYVMVLFMAFLGIYAIRSLSLGQVLLLPVCFLAFLKNSKIKLEDYRDILLFCVYITIQTIILIIRDEPYADPYIVIIKRYIIWMSFVFLLIIVFREIDRKKFYTLYYFLGLICMAGLVFQSIQVYIFKIPMTVIIPFVEYTDKDPALLYSIQRPCSFFLEPQHYASFIIPLLIWNLQQSKLLFSLIITITVILSASTQGILVCAVIWISYMVLSKKININKKFIYVTLVIALGILFLNTNIYTAMNEKLLGVLQNGDTRITRAIVVFLRMPLVDKIFGIGMGHVNNYLGYVDIAPEYHYLSTSPAANFLSTFFGNFIHFGILGGILFAVMLFKMYKQSGTTGKLIVLMILISSFSQTCIFNISFLMFWLIFYLSKNEEEFIRMVRG